MADNHQCLHHALSGCHTDQRWGPDTRLSVLEYISERLESGKSPGSPRLAFHTRPSIAFLQCVGSRTSSGLFMNRVRFVLTLLGESRSLSEAH